MLVMAVTPLLAQDTAILSGVITDPQKAVVADAQISLLESRRGTVKTANSNAEGYYFVQALEPGEYQVEVTKPGFQKLTVEHLVLGVRDRQYLRLQLEVSPLAPTVVTVEAQTEGISTDPGMGRSLSKSFTENLPVNGRRVESLIKLAPGVLDVGAGGDFHVNGLRTGTNYYTLDGVSVGGNGMGGPGGGGMMGGGGGPMGGGMGGGGGIGMSLDSLQEVKVQTTAFAPEFGRTPGAQISMTTRGGGNAFHGDLYYYLRAEQFNANDWFANAYALPRGNMSLKRPGGSVSGPVIKKKTFFFANVEHYKVDYPQTISTPVVNTAVRNTAPAAVKRILNVLPQPNGLALINNVSLFNAVSGNTTDGTTATARLDHTINTTMNAYLRYTGSTGKNTNVGSVGSPSTTTDGDNKNHSLLAAFVHSPNAATTNEVRASYTLSDRNGTNTLNTMGGAQPITVAQALGVSSVPAGSLYSLNIFGTGGVSIGGISQNKQRQLNVIDNLTAIAGAHTYKMGIDYRRTDLTESRSPYGVNLSFNGLTADEGGLLSTQVMTATVNASLPKVYPTYSNFSAYLQDTYKASPKLTVTVGMRWDVNPAPTTRSGPKPFALCTGGPCTVTQNAKMYETRWADLSPRLGFVYTKNQTPGKELVIRGGVGVFTDSGFGSSAMAFSGAPYTAVKNLTLVDFPLSAANVASPALPAVKPYGMISTADNQLLSPRVTQFNVTIEKSLSPGQLLSVGYVGTRGSRLLRTSTTPSYSEDYQFISVAANGASSKYNALQAQYRRRLGKGSQVQVAYTYGHSMDSASNEMGAGGGMRTILGDEMGSSDYDVRHSINVSGFYNIPYPKMYVVKELLGGWSLNWLLSARTGLPFDVRGQTTSTYTYYTSSTTTKTVNVIAQVRPDYVYGQNVWTSDAKAPGGKRLNLAAFAIPVDDDGAFTGVQGNLGRNALRGNGALQADFSLRRAIQLTEKARLLLSADAYNVMNHANFANPSNDQGANMASPIFGLFSRTLNMGGGGVYSSSGPRNLELSLRFQF